MPIDHHHIASCSADGCLILWLEAQQQRALRADYLRWLTRDQIVEYAEAEMKAEGIEIYMNED